MIHTCVDNFTCMKPNSRTHTHTHTHTQNHNIFIKKNISQMQNTIRRYTTVHKNCSHVD